MNLRQVKSIDVKKEGIFLKNKFVEDVSKQFKVLIKKNLKIPIQFYQL